MVIRNEVEYRNIYSVYGLKVMSEIPMPELTDLIDVREESIDVTISYGIVPEKIEGGINRGSFLKVSKREFYLYIRGTAKYYVSNGSNIIVQPEEHCNMEELKIFLLGSCFGMLLTQRSIVAIHGGSVVINGQGLIVTGNMGAGKSTLTSALRKKGYNFLANDVTALRFHQDNNFCIYPTYPQQKLCRDAMEKMGYDTRNYSIIDIDRDKYSIPVKKGFSNIPVALSAIYEIIVMDKDDVEIYELSGAEKLKSILKNIYRSEISRLVGYKPEYFKQCIELAQKIPMYRIIRPKNGFTVETQIEFIKKSLNLSV